MNSNKTNQADNELHEVLKPEFIMRIGLTKNG